MQNKTFSIINVMAEKDGKVDGYWMQDHIGTCKTALEVCRRTNEANGDSLNIVLTEKIWSTVPLGTYYEGLIKIVE